MGQARKLLGLGSLIVGIALLVYVAYINSIFGQTPRTFSPYTLLTASWEQYKILFINRDGRVIDHTLGDVTTSEGQSYALLRAVWIDDKETFDKVWKWTKDNLQREDKLFSWKWGKTESGTYGFANNADKNAAADADSDIALALLLASRRWNHQWYLDEAKQIIDGIWKVETATANGKRYLVAGNWAKNTQTLIVNPSYFSPYAWRMFAGVDKKNNWNSLIAPAYELLSQVGTTPLKDEKPVGLPPDWVAVDTKTGTFSAPSIANLKTDYSYDAVRTPWRIALDYYWFNDPQAKDYLQSYEFLFKAYEQNKVLATGYSRDGKPLQNFEHPTMYATALGAFMIHRPELAKQMYEEKIVKLYSNDRNSFNEDIPYYEQNWLWFGAAMYNKMLNKF